MIIETPLPGRTHRGKVRDTYDLGGGRLLMVATDRISAFDVVLPTGIPDKGLVLNRISAFWFDKTGHIVPNHLICLADTPEAATYLAGGNGSGLSDRVPAEVAARLEETSKKVYEFARDYALERGIILADTKMEFGTLDGELILIDELLTPDSSRFWDAEGYSPGRSQPNFDKQFVRDWLDEQGWDHEPPAPDLPEDVTARTTERYREAYVRLTGESL